MNIQTVQNAMFKRAKERTVAEQMALDEDAEWDAHFSDLEDRAIGAANNQGIDTNGNNTISGTVRQGTPSGFKVNGQSVQVPKTPGSNPALQAVNTARQQGIIQPGQDWEAGSPEYNQQRGGAATWTVNGKPVQTQKPVQPQFQQTQPKQPRQPSNDIKPAEGFRQL